MTWQWSARCMSNEPDVAGGALQHSLPKDWESHCCLWAGFDVCWKLRDTTPGGVASPQQNDPCVQGPVRAGQARSGEWSGMV